MKILLVEDESAIREVEAAYLMRAGYTVVQATGGDQALELFESARFDLVALDLNLPGTSGLDVCRRIRETSTVPIVIVTARSSEIDELIGVKAA